MTTTDDLVFENEEWVDKTIPEDTLVKARLDEIKPNKRMWNDPKDIDPATGQPKAKEIFTLEWWWTVTDDRDDGLYYDRRVKGECKPDMNTNPRNRLNQWSAALRGREIGVGEKINLRDLIGLSAYISVEHKPDKNDPTMKWERVIDVTPITMFADDAPPF